jgi:hypothetical protein
MVIYGGTLFKTIAWRTTYTVQYELHEIGNDLTLNQSAG